MLDSCYVSHDSRWHSRFNLSVKLSTCGHSGNYKGAIARGFVVGVFRPVLET